MVRTVIVWRKSISVYTRYLMFSVVHTVMYDVVNAGLRNFLARLKFVSDICGHCPSIFKFGGHGEAGFYITNFPVRGTRSFDIRA